MRYKVKQKVKLVIYIFNLKALCVNVCECGLLACLLMRGKNVNIYCLVVQLNYKMYRKAKRNLIFYASFCSSTR